MRRLASIPSLAILVLLGLAAPARVALADDGAGPGPRALSFELGLWGGDFLANKAHEFYDSDDESQVPLKKHSPEVGLRLGFYPFRVLGIEGESGATFSKTRDRGQQVNIFALRAQVVVQLPARVTPFLLVGVGNFISRSEALGDDRDFDYHLGVGAKLFATKNFQIRIDGRLYRSNQLRMGGNDNGEINHYAIDGGLAWVFGGRGATPAPSDKDGDGVNDAADACPADAGDPPTGCPAGDKDGDGLTDDLDRCPAEAENVNGVDDTDGCPDQAPDTDGDGIRGEADKCPDQAEDVDSFEDEDGCPDEDNDKDSLLDAGDACPTEAGPAENRGCPDKDRDGDTVVDRLDNCPDEAGTTANQGCKAKQLVVITKDQLKILDLIYFKTGKAIIERKSNKLLNNVASVLTNHPEIKKIRIEGHTDSQGSDSVNKKLSQDRAEAVANYLSKQGISADRLEPIGFGEEKPIADNLTKAGRAENRRVEFNIVSEPNGAPAAPATPAPAPTTP
jgi:outer membrane protein OmpA-like peptidoglycan-associated protein